MDNIAIPSPLPAPSRFRLHSLPTRGMDVVDSGNAAKGESKNDHVTHRRNRHCPGHGPEREAETHQKGPTFATSRATCARQDEVGQEASPPRKAPKARTKATVTKPGARPGGKTAKILDLFKWPGGVTVC